jgi:copper(I)-binding protein
MLVAAAVVACRHPDRGGRATAGGLHVTHAVMWGLPEAAVGTVGFRLENRGGLADTLTGVTSPAATVTLHDVTASAASRHMIRIGGVAVPPGARLVFGPGRPHLMLSGVDSGVWTRDTIPIGLRFARGGTISLSVPVLRVTEALEELEGK